MIEKWNIELFHWINASSHPATLAQNFAYFCAEILIYVLAAGIVIAWIYHPQRRFRAILLCATVSAGLGLAVNQLIGVFWYHPRPFELGIGHTLVRHVPETSFPSDHGVVFFAIGLALLWITGTRRWGVGVIAAGMVVAWSRIYIGVHFPADMLGSFIVSLLATRIAHLFLPFIEQTLEPGITRLYEFLVRILHLPASIFPLSDKT